MNGLKISDEQIVKIECDAYALFEATMLLLRQRHSIGAVPTSCAHISLGTAAMINFGLAVELRLKAVHYWAHTPIKPVRLREHSFVKIFDLFEPPIKELFDCKWSTILAQGVEDIAVFYVQGKEEPERPTGADHDVRDFHGVLAVLDEHCLFHQRYSFEQFSSGEWHGELLQEFMVVFWNLLGEVSGEVAAD